MISKKKFREKEGEGRKEGLGSKHKLFYFGFEVWICF